jgi:hypothetical protein
MRTAWRVVLVAMASCSRGPEVEAPGAENATEFHPALLEATAAYETLGRVDDEMRWAPYLCRLPMPGVARVSESGDAASHGQKLYSLFAKNREEYIHLTGDTVAAGQVVIKESWGLEEIPEASAVVAGKTLSAAQQAALTEKQKVDYARASSGFYPYAKKDGKTFRATERAGLYVMMKLATNGANTDQGWVYGTLTMDRKITSAGRVASCMGCHESADHDRLFGIVYTGL